MKKKELKESVTKRGKAFRELIKKKAVDYLGGSCKLCGYNKCIAAFDFHHRNPEEKEFEINKGLSNHYSWKRILLELDKCKLSSRNTLLTVEIMGSNPICSAIY